MKILYLHGIGSGADSRTPRELRKAFPDDIILAPELPVSPKVACEYIMDIYDKEGFDLVIGTSLGGFYALTLPMVRKILVNPALYADEDIVGSIGYGIQTFFCKRSDGATEYEIDENFIGELHEIRQRIYGNKDMLVPDRLDHNLLNETYAFFGMNDKVLHHYDDFCELFIEDHAYKCEAEHRLSTEDIKNVLAPLIRKVMAEPPTAFCAVMDEDLFL